MQQFLNPGKIKKSQLSPLEAQIKHCHIQPINRGFNAVIEATVEATRYVVLKDKKYLDNIEYYNKIAPTYNVTVTQKGKI
jgi:hypothetical protein